VPVPRREHARDTIEATEPALQMAPRSNES